MKQRAWFAWGESVGRADLMAGENTPSEEEQSEGRVGCGRENVENKDN